MTKSIKCSDVVDCDWKATAKTEEELMKKILEHAKEHRFNEIQKELLPKIKAPIKDQMTSLHILL
jgi:predicted small metal-binding protein